MTERQKRFAEFYAACGNAAEAARQWMLDRMGISPTEAQTSEQARERMERKK